MSAENRSLRSPDPARTHSAAGASLRSGAVLVVLLAMVPVCALYLFLVGRQLQSDREHLESRLRERSNQLAFAVDATMRGSFDTLHRLALAESMQRGPDAVGPLLGGALEERPEWIAIFLARPDGDILIERGVALGVSGLNLDALPEFRDQLRQGRALAGHHPVRDWSVDAKVDGTAKAGTSGNSFASVRQIGAVQRRAVVLQIPLNLHDGGRHVLGVVMSPAIWYSLLERTGAVRAASPDLARDPVSHLARDLARSLAHAAAHDVAAAAMLAITDSGGEVIVQDSNMRRNARLPAPTGAGSHAAAIDAAIDIDIVDGTAEGSASASANLTDDATLNASADAIVDGYGRLTLPGKQAVFVAAGPIPGTRWQARASVLAQPFEAGQRRALAMSLALTSLALGFGIALALLLARRIGVLLDRLCGAVSALGGSAPVPELTSWWREIERLNHALRGARARWVDEARQLREAERRVRESEQRLEMAQEAGSVGFFDYDFSRRLAVWTSGLARLFGIGVQHFEGSLSDWARRIAPDDAQALKRYFIRSVALRQGDVAYEFRAILPGGQLRWLACRGRLHYDDSGAPIRMIGVSVDITTTKTADTERAELLAREQYVRAEAEQRALEAERSRALLETLMAHVPEGITIVEGPPYYAAIVTSAYGLEAVGPLDDFSQADCGDAGRPGSLLLPDGTHAPAPEQTPLYRASRRGERVINEEYILVRRDGRRLGVLINATPIRSKDGRLLGAISSWRDITTLKQLEQELRALLGREQSARRAAEEANRAKDEFLAMLGHELRNPLAAISAAARVLERQAGGAAPAEHADVAAADAAPSADFRGARMAARAREIIARQTGHLARLMDDLLDTGRAINGKIVLQRCPVDLAEAVSRALSTLSAAGSLERHRLLAELQTVVIDADATRVEQIATNLIVNAIKYTPPGGTIHVRVRCDGDAALLLVVDSGIGISPALLPRVFDLFVQGEGGLHRDQGGLGIGLTLVRRLVELHGGTVQAQSDGLDCGSTFSVRFERLQSGVAPGADGGAPVASSAFHASASFLPARSSEIPDAGLPESAQKAMRIALVEDNDDGREMLKTLLEILGHTVFEAADGESGVEMVTRTVPDLALFDIGLPGIDGYEAARRIRAMPATSDVTLVALTGYGLPEDRRRAAEAGFDAHLVKPVDPDKLHAMLAVLHGGVKQPSLVNA